MAARSENNSFDLEAQLAGVLEQDGITMSSSEGLRRRVKRTKRREYSQPLTPVFFSESEPRHDVVADLDSESIDLLIKSVEGVKSSEVIVTTDEKPRSAYVLSLRSLLFAKTTPSADERISLAEVYSASEPIRSTIRKPEVYKTITHDLTVERHDPRSFSEQFTPHNFFDAERKAYGRLERAGDLLSALFSDLFSLVHRVERVERRFVDEVQDTLAVVEVPRLSLARSLAGFAALLLVITLPANAVVLYRTAADTKDVAENSGNAALQDLLSVKESGSLPSSVAALKRASTRFREADAVLSDSSALAIGIASVLPKQYRTARALLEIGDKSSEAGRLLAVAFDKIFSDPSRRLDERLDVLAAYARGALPLLADAQKAAATIDQANLPSDKQASFVSLASKLTTAAESAAELATMADLLSALAGKSEARNFLLVFQNNTELRPTGGFMGSVAEITLDRGEIKKMFVPPGGTYDLKGQLVAHVISPEPLHLINPHWQLQDANWSPDFPTAAKKIRWFWSKSGQPTLDGVIALNASFVERLLDLTGPIEMPEYGKIIDRSNFLIETQKAVEVEYDRVSNTPKKFVGDLAKVMLERIRKFSSTEWLETAALLSEGLQTKEIQVALTDVDEQAKIEKFGWGGQLKNTQGDSLALIEANIAGQKTDGVVAEKVDLVAEVQADGSIIDHVTMTRTHTGSKGEMFRGVRNVSYLRAYVPRGSRLLSASGFEKPAERLFKKPDEDYISDPDLEPTAFDESTGVEIGEEGSRTVFGGWLQLDPGETQTISYSYRLPFTVHDIHDKLNSVPSEDTIQRAAYLLLLSSQSGKTSRAITVSLKLPGTWKAAWQRGTNDESSVSYSGLWDRDRVMAALLSP